VPHAVPHVTLNLSRFDRSESRKPSSNMFLYSMNAVDNIS
jgi:hypothetical protein